MSRDPLARTTAPLEYDPSDEDQTGHEPGKNGDGPAPARKIVLLPARDLEQFLVPPDNDPSVLLGNRYLCRGDGLVLASSSGMGKSSIVIQAAVTWALGRPFMGIQPNGCLRSLIIQSEDSDGDVGEVWASICFMMQLTAEERAHVKEYVKLVTDRTDRGLIFLGQLGAQLAAAPYDLVWINPLVSFAKGDIANPEVAGDFLREGLNGLNAESKFAYAVVHHTTKPATGKDRKERKWHEIMYDMAGSYEIIGWARCIMSLRPTDTFGEFNLVLAKRGRRAGVTKKTPQGIGFRMESTIIVPIQHTNKKMTVPGVTKELDVIFWEAREEVVSESAPERPNGRPKKNAVADFIGIFPVGIRNAKGVNELLKEALKIRMMGKSGIYSIINDALETRLIVCDSSNPRSPVYYVRPPSSRESQADFGDAK